MRTGLPSGRGVRIDVAGPRLVATVTLLEITPSRAIFPCPDCGAPMVLVGTRVRSRLKMIWRRRRCIDSRCAGRLTSHEVAVDQ